MNKLLISKLIIEAVKAVSNDEKDYALSILDRIYQLVNEKNPEGASK